MNDKAAPLSAVAVDPLVSTCATCKAFGAQGMSYRKERGDRRWCAIAMFGDFYRDTAPMPEWKVSYGDAGDSKGQITVHKDFGCINHDPNFE